MGNVICVLLGPGVQVWARAIGLRCRRYGKQNDIVKYYYILIIYKYYNTRVYIRIPLVFAIRGAIYIPVIIERFH